jgi:sec-independent protein translocase protein TatA
MRLQGWEWIIILVIVLLLWGAPKLPALAKSMGQSLKIFRGEMKKPEGESREKKTKADETPKSE